ncbi:MAG TPA: MFS transporter [Vicinamibacterales bacterium]|nr:MFS transporter [Vicinamibacterales bacterium]
MATAGSRPFYGPWIIAACLVTFGLASGLPYYNIAFFYDYLRDDHHWTQQMVTLGAPVAILATIWAGPLLAHRFNPRYLIVAGTGLTCLAFQWFGRLHGSSTEYYAAWCVYMLGYLLSGPIPHQIIISNWYRRNRGQAMGIAYIGGALAGAVGNKLAPWLVSVMSYRSAIQVLGLLLLLAWPLALFVLKDRPEDLGQHPDGDAVRNAPALDAAESLGFAELSRRSSFWFLLVGSAASIGSIACVNFLMKFVFEEQGFTSQAARDQIWSTASFAALIAAIAGRIVVGWLADRLSRKTVMVATYAQVAVAIPLLFLVTPETPHYAYLFGVVFGFAMGADYMLIPLMAADVFGLRSLGRAMSAIVPSDTITQYWAPNLIARLRVVWGGYGTALWAACAIAAIGAVAIALLPGDASERAPAVPQPAPRRQPSTL